jgi:hypothetical protein
MTRKSPFIVQGASGAAQTAVVDPKLVTEWGLWKGSARLEQARSGLSELLIPDDPNVLVGKTRQQLKKSLGSTFSQVTETLTIVTILEMADEVGFSPRMSLQDVFQSLHECVYGLMEPRFGEAGKFVDRIQDRLLKHKETEQIAHAHLTPEHVISLYERRILRKGDFRTLAEIIDRFDIDFLPYSTREVLPESVCRSVSKFEIALDEGVFEKMYDELAMRYVEFEDSEGFLPWSECRLDIIALCLSHVRSTLSRYEMDNWIEAPLDVVGEVVNQLFWERDVSGEEISFYRTQVIELSILLMRRVWKRMFNTLYPEYR